MAQLHLPEVWGCHGSDAASLGGRDVNHLVLSNTPQTPAASRACLCQASSPQGSMVTWGLCITHVPTAPCSPAEVARLCSCLRPPGHRPSSQEPAPSRRTLGRVVRVPHRHHTASGTAGPGGVPARPPRHQMVWEVLGTP